jgi:hypothetical protein
MESNKGNTAFCSHFSHIHVAPLAMDTTLLVFVPLLLLFLSGAIVIIIIFMHCDYERWFKHARSAVDAKRRQRT